MPTTVSAALILALAILPGLLGDKVFEALVGTHWREKDFRTVLRLLAFSAAGVTIYALIAQWMGLPPPVHLMPSNYQEAVSDIQALNRVFPPYAGHILGGTLSGLLAAWGNISMARYFPRSAYPAAWDDFVRTYAADRWVIVGLKNEESFAGRLINADITVPTGERDLVLAEPCRFSPKDKNYFALNYQYLFIPADSLYSIAGIAQEHDERLLNVGDSLFKESPEND